MPEASPRLLSRNPGVTFPNTGCCKFSLMCSTRQSGCVATRSLLADWQKCQRHAGLGQSERQVLSVNPAPMTKPYGGLQMASAPTQRNPKKPLKNITPRRLECTGYAARNQDYVRGSQFAGLDSLEYEDVQALLRALAPRSDS